jgi:hypothetical protein
MYGELRLHDITAEAGPEEHCPEFRAGLEALGWVTLGRVRLGTETQLRELIDEYPVELRAELLRLELLGTTVLRSPDTSAFALVDWFFRCPFTHMMTLLDDGTLVETHEAWSTDPIQTSSMKTHATWLNRRREQLRFRAEGRHIELVDDPTPESLSRAHHDHVDQVSRATGARPLTHNGLPQQMDLWNQQYAHGSESMKRAGLMAGCLPQLATAPILLALLTYAFWQASHGRDIPGGSLPIAVVMVVLLAGPMWLTPRLMAPMSYIRSLAPPFRGRPW